MANNPRARLAASFVQAAGPTVVTMQNLLTGWPSEITVNSGGVQVAVDLYISQVGSHSRKSYEMRFQNPAGEDQRPIRVRPGRAPLLLGFSIDPSPLCVIAEIDKRIDSSHRFSVLFPIELLKQASTLGWGEYVSEVNEKIVAFPPSLLGAFLQVRGVLSSTKIDTIIGALQDSGFDHDDSDDTKARAIIAVNRVARDAKFSRDVSEAYQGNCGLCGLDWGLVEAAHIFPVSAPGSPDKVWNGICLCGTHHKMFDAHLLHIDPVSYAVKFHPKLGDSITPIGQNFLERTTKTLILPSGLSDRPRKEMFDKRYNWFDKQYNWAS